MTSSPRQSSLAAQIVPPPSAAIVVWLFVQVAAIALAEAGFRLSAFDGNDTRSVPVVLLLGAQIVVSALIFPLLLRSLRGLILAIASSLPFLALTGRSAGFSFTLQLGEFLFLALWLTTLHPWAKLAARGNRRLLAVAVGGLCTLGLPLVAYAGLEFGSFGLGLSQFLPLLAAGDFGNFHLPPPLKWAILLAFCGTGALVARSDRIEPEIQKHN